MYHTLMDVYTMKELGKLDDWLDKIDIGNKVMEGLHEDIQRVERLESRENFGSRKVLQYCLP